MLLLQLKYYLIPKVLIFKERLIKQSKFMYTHMHMHMCIYTHICTHITYIAFRQDGKNAGAKQSWLIPDYDCIYVILFT